MELERRAIALDDAPDLHRIGLHAAVARTLAVLPVERVEGKKRIADALLHRASFVGAFLGRWVMGFRQPPRGVIVCAREHPSSGFGPLL
jgi:hypothetical protein